MNAFLIFPHQLFAEIHSMDKADSYYCIESDLFFKQYPFHKQKLLFHRASMRFYADSLIEKGYNLTYIEANHPCAHLPRLMEDLIKEGIQTIYFFDPNDYLLEKQIQQAFPFEKVMYPSPNFLNTDLSLLGEKKTYFQTAFYINQRKIRSILLDSELKPIGGQWSYDAENRKKIPKNTAIPNAFPTSVPSAHIQEAIAYVDQHFPNNPGSSDQPFSSGYFPCTPSEAEAALDLFIQEKLSLFGLYEDAMQASEGTLFHSVLSPMINVGLLNPAYVLAKIIASNAPLNSMEGIIRQLIGWREFIQLLYRKIGSRQRTSNHWQFTREMPTAFYTGTTGIEPVDITIHKLVKTGYNHHIERLMVLGNFMLLCEIKPDAVYQWFMEMYIDAYDWVMVPNVYGMSQFSDGGLMSTKPYICGSNYILKMGDFKKGPWQAIWDGLFWRFLDKQRSTFAKNPRWAMLISTWDKMPTEKKSLHLAHANNFLEEIL